MWGTNVEQEKNEGLIVMSRLALASASERTQISIGIPAYNEAARIHLLLEGILVQADKNIKEIIINECGSTDGTGNEAVRTARTMRQSSMVKLITGKRRKGKAAALNSIIKMAEGDLVVFIDADVIPGKDCIRKLVEQFSADTGIGLISGNVVSLNTGGGFCSFASNFLRELHHSLCLHLTQEGLSPKVNGTFFAIRRGVVKHFPYWIVSDDEYASWCAQRKGYKVTYVHDAVVYTMDPTTIKDYIAKRKRVLSGHLSIKKSMNHTVPTTRIGPVSARLVGLVLRNWKKLPHIVILIMFEVLCRIMAFCDVTRGRIPYRYRVDSAKF